MCIYVYVHMYTHTRIRTHTHTARNMLSNLIDAQLLRIRGTKGVDACVRARTRLYVATRTHAHVSTHARTHAHVPTDTNTSTHTQSSIECTKRGQVCVCARARVCVCVCVCVCARECTSVRVAQYVRIHVDSLMGHTSSQRLGRTRQDLRQSLQADCCLKRSAPWRSGSGLVVFWSMYREMKARGHSLFLSLYARLFRA